MMVAVSAMRKVFMYRDVYCVLTPDVIVMKKHDSVIEPHTGLRRIIFGAGVIAVLLVGAGMAAGATAGEEAAA